MSPAQIAVRFKFAKEYLHLTVKNWRLIIWTDEIGMQMGANEGLISRCGDIQKKNTIRTVLLPHISMSLKRLIEYEVRCNINENLKLNESIIMKLVRKLISYLSVDFLC